jgi:hypothetical protein
MTPQFVVNTARTHTQQARSDVTRAALCLAIIALSLAWNGCKATNPTTNPTASTPPPPPLLETVQRLLPSHSSLLGQSGVTVVSARDQGVSGFNILQIDKLSPPHGIRLYIALAADHSEALALSGQPENFNRMVQASSLQLKNAADAGALLTLFVQTTRPGRKRFRLIESVSDLPFMPGDGSDPEFAAKIAAAKKRASSLVKAMVITASPHGFAVEATVLKHQNLELMSAEVSQAKGVVASYTLLSDNLPLVYSN